MVPNVRMCAEGRRGETAGGESGAGDFFGAYKNSMKRLIEAFEKSMNRFFY